MVICPTAQLFWRKLCGIPRRWFHTNEGKRICAKMVMLVYWREGRDEARALLGLIRVAQYDTLYS